MYTITIAWVAMDGTRETEKYYRFDGVNYKKKLETCPRAHAVVWLNSGAKNDIAKAIEYANELSDKEVVKVYHFPTDEKQPLEKSREMIMTSFSGE